MEHSQTIELTNRTSSYMHKKFSTQKRKRFDVEHILEQHKENIMEQAPHCKRRQLKPIFRPWLDNEQNLEFATASKNKISEAALPKHTATPHPFASTYHANMVRHCQSVRQRSPKEQQRRDRNTLACLLNRRSRQLQDAHLAQQYEQYRIQQAAILEQQVRFSLYYRQLLQQAVFQRGVNAIGFELPQQQQQFLQQMAVSQQLMIFGSQR